MHRPGLNLMHRKGRKMTLCDSHAHIGSSKELEERRIKGVRSLLCAGNPREAVKLYGPGLPAGI